MSQTFFTVLTTVFLAEVGDKTQMATMLFAAEGNGFSAVGTWTIVVK